jgi:hypothetical protein
VNLAALEAAAEENDPALTDVADRGALRAASHRLHCNPLDGNAWLRYAMVNARGKGPPALVIDQLSLSYRLAPNEGWVIEPRLAFATNLYLSGAASLQPGYLADLRLFTSFEAPGQVASAYVETPPRVRVLLRPLISGEPERRKNAIIGEIERRGVHFVRD